MITPSASPTPAPVGVFKVLSVGDGDTLRVGDGRQKLTIRLASIDAPEMAQRGYGSAARQRLKELAPVGAVVAFRSQANDKYGRTLAEVFVNGRSINLAMVFSGQAFAYGKYLGTGRLTFLEAEAAAQRQGLGVWRVPEGIQRPWDWRSGERFTCEEIGDFDRAQELLRQGHTYLDRNGNGIACESLRSPQLGKAAGGLGEKKGLSTLCFIPMICLLFGCNETKYETIKLESPATINCEGGQYNNGKITELQILSSNVTIKDCKINGSVRTIGLGRNGEAAGVKASSLELGHTERAQAAAPKNTVLSNLTITGYGRIPVYLGPGTTEFTLHDSTIKGHSKSVALYLDAESSNNTIRGNTFRIAEATREMIAVDGSANNQITGNIIKGAANGGIYLYRNCGEGGTVRHQAPQYNVIADNTIDNVGGYGVWLGSRNGNRSYCKDDFGFSFGSSMDDGDFADNNTVRDNVYARNDRAIAPSPR